MLQVPTTPEAPAPTFSRQAHEGLQQSQYRVVVPEPEA
jgi:hypothetical protein